MVLPIRVSNFFLKLRAFKLIAVPCSPSCADFRSKSALCDVQVCSKHPCLHFIRTTNNTQDGVSFPGAVDDSFYSFSINTLY